MCLKKATLVLLLAVLMVPAALADDVDFSLQRLSWSWAGGLTPLQGTSSLVIASGEVGGQVGSAIVGPAHFSTGTFLGGLGTLANPFTWAGAAPGTFTIGGCGGPCFTGNIVSASLAHNASGNLLYTADFVIGNVSSALFTAMGIPVPANLQNWTGSFSATLHGTANALHGGHSTIGSGDLVIQAPVPEPGTLAMFGSGLIGIAGLLRRKLLG